MPDNVFDDDDDDDGADDYIEGLNAVIGGLSLLVDT